MLQKPDDSPIPAWLTAGVKSISPSLMGTYNAGDARGVAVVGNYAYVADGTSGLHIVDISTPATPTLVGTYNTSGFAHEVVIIGNYAYVADSTSGLQIIDVRTPATPTLVGCI